MLPSVRPVESSWIGSLTRVFTKFICHLSSAFGTSGFHRHENGTKNSADHCPSPRFVLNAKPSPLNWSSAGCGIGSSRWRRVIERPRASNANWW